MRSAVQFFFLIFNFLIINSTHGQFKVQVLGEDEKKLSYVNVFMEKENIGQHTNIDAEILFSEKFMGAEVVFSKAGYIDTAVNINSNEKYIFMRKSTLAQVQFPDVEGKRVIRLGDLGNENSGALSNSNAPYVYLKYFSTKNAYGYYLDLLKLRTKSEIATAKVNIRFYRVNEDGSPGNYFYDENVIFDVKVGERITKVDLSELKLRMPENGLFIGIEPLIIPENIYRFEERNLITDEISERVDYMPTLVVIRQEKSNLAQQLEFVHVGGQFVKISADPHSAAIELKLKRP